MGICKAPSIGARRHELKKNSSFLYEMWAKFVLEDRDWVTTLLEITLGHTQRRSISSA